MREAWQSQFGRRTIVHVDMDAFFAQIEALDHPEYRGKPLIVGGLRDSPRGVVSTCSYEARKFGVRSAMSIKRAVQLCPDAIFVPVRMSRYEEVSQQIRRILSDFTPVVEPLSIDEAFLDFTGCEHFYDDPRHLGLTLKRRIFESTGLTSSVGIAPNKFLAKLASDYRKPDGLVIVSKSDIDRFLTPMPVSAIWGVGPKTADRLRQVRIHTVADIRKRSLSSLIDLLGTKSGEHIYALAFGRDDRPVEPMTEAKSIGRETTFDVDIHDGPHLRARLARFAADVGARLRSEGLWAKTVTVKIRYPDFETHTKSHTMPEPFRDDDTIYQTASYLLDGFRLKRPLRLLGIYVSHFQKHVQTSLFSGTTDTLTDVVDTLNQKLGHHAIRRGRELQPADERPPTPNQAPTPR